MAIYLLNPTQDSTIYSQYPTQNTGLDEQLVIGNGINSLLKFPSIDSLITGSSNVKVELRLFYSSGESLTDNIQINANSIFGSWDEGIGSFYHSPIATSGVSWLNKKDNQMWLSAGGDLYSGSVSTIVRSDSTKDITLNVTGMNLTDGLSISSSNINAGVLYYFSRQTKSIHKPILSVSIPDYTLNATGSIITSDQILLSTGNTSNIPAFGQHRINVFTRPKVVPRLFRTSIKPVYYLPYIAYYELRDINVDYSIIKGDPIYTRLSSDDKGNYFVLNCDNIPRARYYELSIYYQIDNFLTKYTLPNHLYID